MSLIDSMQTLKDDIKSGRQKRRQDLKTIKHVTKQLQQDTHKMVADSEKIRREEASSERKKLSAFTKDLKQDVLVLREKSREDQTKVREDVLGAGRVWRKVSATKDESGEDEGEKE